MANLIEAKGANTFDAVLARTAEQVRAGVAEMDRRLGHAADGDSRVDGVATLGKELLAEQVAEDDERKAAEQKVFAWPKPPTCEYFEGNTGRVRRVRRRAIAIVEGRPVEPYVAEIECRNRYLDACVHAYRLLLYGA